MTARKTGTEPSPATLELAEDLRRAIGSFVRAVRDRAEAEKSAQSETLGLLDREGWMNVAGLAQRRGVTHQTMRLVVAQMEADGLVERSADPADRRSRLLALSEKGRRELARGREARASKIGVLIDRSLSAADQAQLRQSIRLLDRLREAAED